MESIHRKHVADNDTDDDDPLQTPAARALALPAQRKTLDERVGRVHLPLVPTWMSPNQLTALNHGCCWVLFIVGTTAFLHKHSTLALIMCAMMNHACMILDTLDGMWARKTGKVSKRGEFLDHWLDALHVPLIGAAGISTLRLPQWAAVIASILNVAVYNAEMVVYHCKHVWVPTSGFAGQMAFTAFMMMAAYYAKEPDSNMVVYAISRTVAVISIVVTAILIVQQMVNFDRRMVRKFMVFNAFNVTYAWLFLTGNIDLCAFLLLLSMTSFRITGNFVLYSLLKKPYSGWHLDMVILTCIMVAISLVMPTAYPAFALSSVIPVSFLNEYAAHPLLQVHFYYIQHIIAYAYVLILCSQQLNVLRRAWQSFKGPQ